MFKLGVLSLKKQLIYYLRSTKSFTKSRYSRGRQWSKVIVYFGLWFNIGSVLGSFFFTYQFSLRLGYLWWVLFFVVNLFVFRLFITTTITKRPNFELFFNKLRVLISIGWLKMTNNYIKITKFFTIYSNWTL